MNYSMENNVSSLVKIETPMCPCCGEALDFVKVMDIDLVDLTYVVKGDCRNDNGCKEEQWLEVEINR